MNFPSKLIEDAVTEISRLPGIGKKTALRLTLHLLKQKEPVTTALTDALLNLRKKYSTVKYVTIFQTMPFVAFVRAIKEIKV